MLKIQSKNHSIQSQPTSESQISEQGKYLHQNVSEYTQSIQDYRYTQIGIITGKRSKEARVEVLGNGSLISQWLGLTNLNTIAFIKNYELHQYLDLVFYPFPHGQWKTHQGYKILKVQYPQQTSILNPEKDFEKNEQLALFKLQKRIQNKRDFLKPTVLKCRTCLFGNNQKSLRICGYSFIQDLNQISNLGQKVALFGLEKQGRVESISSQNKLLYFKILAKQVQRGCPLFADNRYVGIYLQSRFNLSIGLLFTEQMINNMRLFEQGIGGDSFQIQVWPKCPHNHLIAKESQYYLDQLKNIQFIDNSGNEMSNIHNLQHCSKLKYLFLSNNKLKSIQFYKINNGLIQLNLSYNNIKTAIISLLTSLQKLDISHNCLKKIDVSSICNLTGLNLSNNRMKQSINIDNNTKLINLNISNNRISNISLCKNSNLVILQLDHNDLSDIHLEYNKQLKKLDLSHNKLSKINLKDNIKLQTVLLNNNYINQINLQYNSKLKKINLQYNKLPNQMILSNPNLKRISLNNNNELELLEIKSQNLRQMHLSRSNQMQTPVQLTRVNKINKLTLHEKGRYSNKHIIAQNCQVNSFQEQRKCKILCKSVNLTILTMHNMGLEYSDIKSLRFLKILDFSGNKIQRIFLTSNKELIHLNVSNNRLKQLNLDSNLKLIILQASRNILQIINLLHNKQLRYINLSKNRISQINLTGNPKLQCLILNENNLQQINTTNNRRLTTLILNPDRIRSIRIFYNKELFKQFKSINPQAKKQNGDPHTKQINENNDRSERAARQLDFLIQITIRCLSSEQLQCRGYIQKLQMLRQICFFEEQSEDPIVNKSPTYNNFIFKLQVGQTII